MLSFPDLRVFAQATMGVSTGGFIIAFLIMMLVNPDFCRSERHVEKKNELNLKYGAKAKGTESLPPSHPTDYIEARVESVMPRLEMPLPRVEVESGAQAAKELEKPDDPPTKEAEVEDPNG